MITAMGFLRRRAQLLGRIHRQHYLTRQRTLRIAGLELHFVQIEDPDRVLDRVAEEEDLREKLSGRRSDGDPLHLPYWAELWDSATGIGQYLIRSFGRSITNRQVLDLGCGMGLAGAVAARLGMRVLFADLEPPALLFAALNSLPDAGRVRTRRLNWQTDRLDQTFDLILGADILYERKQWDFLEPFWRAHLAPGGTLLLGEPGRQTGDLFAQWITPRGWTLTRHDEPVETRPVPIRLFELRLTEDKSG
jgi:predicted nicotinamide N-methyase